MKPYDGAPKTWLERPVADLRSLRAGDHLCFFYTDEPSRRRVMAAFARQALAAGDRFIYVARDREPSQAAAVLEAEGLNTAAAVRNGQMMFVAHDDVYGAPGQVSHDDVAAKLSKAAADAVDDGFPGLRLASEMDASGRSIGAFPDLLHWERTVSHLQGQTGLTSICQYDHAGLAPAQETLLAAEHTAVALSAGPPPLAAFLASNSPRGLALIGDIDLSNRSAFLKAVEARLAAGTELVVDMAQLRFIDVGSLAGLYHAAGSFPGGARLRLVNVPDLVRRVLEVGAFGQGVVEVDR